MLSELLSACRVSGPAPKGVVPAKFVVSVFHMTRPCRLPVGQRLPPVAVGVFFRLFLLLSLPSLFGCAPLLVPVRRWLLA